MTITVMNTKISEVENKTLDTSGLVTTNQILLMQKLGKLR